MFVRASLLLICRYNPRALCVSLPHPDQQHHLHRTLFWKRSGLLLQACLCKPASPHEIINDVSGDVVNLYRVLREHGPSLAALIQMTLLARAEYDSCYTPSAPPVRNALRRRGASIISFKKSVSDSEPPGRATTSSSVHRLDGR